MKNQKVWFITGASRGFGLDITKAALAAGDKVVATVRSKPEQLKAALQHSDALLVVTLDVTNEAQVKTGVQEAIAHFGRIDVLVNNAGYGLVGATEEVSDQEVRKQFDTNVFGLLNVTRAVLPQMRAQQSGHIINISSLFGYGAGAPGLGLYGATKFAVEGISEGLALEVKPLGIHVTALAPGIFRTEFASADSYQPAANVLEAYAATSGQTRKGINQLHGNQPGDPAKLAQVVLRLADNEHPPLHVPVGRDAIALVRSKAAATAQEIDAWEEVSGNTDFTQA